LSSSKWGRLLEQEWFTQVLLSFDDTKVLKKNWINNICSSVQELLSWRRNIWRCIRKELGSLEDYGW